MTKNPYTAIVGPPRSGTSWLFYYLRANSDVHTRYIKENDWFSQHWGHLRPAIRYKHHKLWEQTKARATERGGPLHPWEAVREERAKCATSQDFKALLEKGAEPGQPLIDVSPSYSLLGLDAFRDMDQTFEGAKIVILLRNPADKAWSDAAHNIKIHGTQLGLVENTLRMMNEPVHGEKEIGLKLNRIPKLFLTAQHVFPVSRIHFLFTEDLYNENQEKTLDDLCAFIGARHSYDPDFSYDRNRGSYDPMPPSLRGEVVARFASTYIFALAKMGRLPSNWQSDIHTFLQDAAAGQQFVSDET